MNEATPLLATASDLGDVEASIDQADRLLHAAADMLDGGQAGRVHQEVLKKLESLQWLEVTDPAVLQRLVDVVHRAGGNPAPIREHISEQAKNRAKNAEKDEAYGNMLTELQTVMQNDAGQREWVVEKTNAVCVKLLESADQYDEETILSGGNLLLEAASESKRRDWLEGTVDIANRLIERANGSTSAADVIARAKALIASAGALEGQAENTSTDQVMGEGSQASDDFDEIYDFRGYNFSANIEKVKTYKGTTLVHYKSAGARTLQNGDAETQLQAVASFAEAAARHVNQAASELTSSEFDNWDPTGSHLMHMLDLQRDWQAVDKNEAMFYDLQKVRTLQAGKPLETNKYNEGIEKAMKAAGWPNDFKEEAFRQARKAVHAQDAELHSYAKDRALAMLHRVAGYLVEERTYQLLKSTHEGLWTEQDTSILGGGTRPDIALPLTGNSGAGKCALLDITADGSQGHILEKQPRWTNSTKVVDSIEIMYPSYDKDTLTDIMLNKQSFTPEQIEERRQAHANRKAQEEQARSNKYQMVKDAFDRLGAKDFKDAVGGLTNAKHLLKAHGIHRKGVDTASLQKVNRDTVALALQKLERALADADALAAEQAAH